jgi:regulation of enolase protein 1 (concanavalin A-like superfamily)
MKEKVAGKEHPWIDGWNRLIADPKSQSTYRATPKPNMGVSLQKAQDDATAAYLNALRWYISGDASYADCAMRNLNAWSATVNQIPSGTDQPGLGGIPIGNFALAAEVLRTYHGWSDTDQTKFKTMLLEYLYPVVNDFLTRHNGASPTAHWANWDAANISSLLAIGVFCDDRTKFDQGVEYFKHGAGMGSIMHAVPFLYPGGLGQWQESGRDHAHALGGMGLLSEACQVAWNQGVDLFGYAGNRLLAGAEYEAQYTQWRGVPYTFYTNANNANQYYISANYRGRLSNSEYYELLYNHYVIVKHLAAPEVKHFAELLRPEGGNADIFGYGTLTYTLDEKASPYPASPVPPVPMELVATAAIDRVYLKWSPSGAYITQGYNVLRSTTSGGPFTSIFSTTGNTTPQYIDTNVEGGKIYYYAVSAINQAGASEHSLQAAANPVTGGPLPKDWSSADIGSPTVKGDTSYAGVAGNTFVVKGGGAGIGGTEDGFQFAFAHALGDFTITARLAEKSNNISKIGLMMRESASGESSNVAMTLGDIGSRQARFSTRSSTGARTSSQPGNDYTWMPVWFRVQRIGDIFTAYQSSDGITWFKVGKSSVAMAKAYLVGIVATSGTDKGAPAVATFDNVTTAVLPPSSPTAPNGLTATAGGGIVTLRWKDNGGGQAGFKIESSVDNSLFYEIADLESGATSFVNTGLASKRYYRIRAYNMGGYSPYSNVVLAEQ